MTKNVYIILLGRYPWAIINAYYAVLKNKRFSPDIVYVFIEQGFLENVDEIISGLKILSEEFGLSIRIEKRVFDNAKFKSIGEEIFAIVSDFKKQGYTIALDITPGRKSLVAAALIALWKIHVDHIFYLAVDEIEDIPYMMKPLPIMKLRDLVEKNGAVP